MPNYKTQWELYFEKVAKTGPIHPTTPELGECWTWLGSKRKSGHGYFWFDGAVRCASQFAWILDDRELVEGLEICHSCDRGWCQNPLHLYQGTHKENLEEMAKKERGTSILTAEQVKSIRERWRQVPRPKLTEIASVFSVSKSAVHAIVAYRNWKHVQ